MSSHSAPSLWSTVAGWLGRTPPPPTPAAPPPRPPAPKVAPEPRILQLAKGFRTELHAAVRAEAGPPRATVQVAEMPTPNSVLPQIVLRPVGAMVRVSRTLLSSFAKPAPPRAAPAEPAPAPSYHPAPETRFAGRDFPIV